MGAGLGVETGGFGFGAVVPAVNAGGVAGAAGLVTNCMRLLLPPLAVGPKFIETSPVVPSKCTDSSVSQRTATAKWWLHPTIRRTQQFA